jgi:uncharacterized metal-binding protein YceD (DUF177 family)
LHKKSDAWRDRPQFTRFAGTIRYFGRRARKFAFDSSSGGPYHARAMGNTLRDSRTPSDLATSGQIIEFNEKIASFENLAQIVEADLLALDPAKLPANWRDSVVAGQLHFRKSGAHDGLPVLEGQVETVIDAVCQRCLEPFRMPLETELRFVFLGGQENNEEYNDEPGEYAVWELLEETLRPLDLVEEGLIMSMPFSAMHTDSVDCSRLEMKTEGVQKTTMPFADLKAQMAGKK